ncbi:hypothetical protein NMG60_11020249 [Bertholletia excelsa]
MAEAQTPAAAPGPATDCTTYLVNISDCLSYVEAGSNRTKPEKGCCPELAGVVDAKPLCICQFLANADSFGVQISVKRALLLPSVCGLKTPSLSVCSAAGYHINLTPSPAPSPAEGLIPKGPPGNGASSSIVVSQLQLALSVGFAIAFFAPFFTS